MSRASMVILTHDSCETWRGFGIFRANIALGLGYRVRGPQPYQQEGRCHATESLDGRPGIAKYSNEKNKVGEP
jgi:hypothetical protein